MAGLAWVAWAAGGAVAYGLLACLSVLFVAQPENVSPFWPPSGLLLGLLLLSDRQRWPLLLLGVVVVSIPANLVAGKSAAVGFSFGAINAMEGLLSAVLLQRLARGPFTLNTPVQVVMLAVIPSALVFVFTALPASAVVVATTPGAPFWTVWRGWVVACSVGTIAVAPALIACRPFAESLRRLTADRARLAEALLLFALAAGYGMAVFGGATASWTPVPPKLYISFPILLWAAFRFGPRGASLVSLIVCLMATWFTARGLGPFGVVSEDVFLRVAMLQSYMITTTLTSLLVASMIAQRADAEQAVAASEALYRRAIVSADAVVYRKDYYPLQFSYVSEGVERLTGIPARDFTPKALDEIVQEIVLRNDETDLDPAEAGRLARLGQLDHWVGDYRVRMPDGSMRWLADSSVQIKDQSGKVTGSLGILQDITRRVGAEERERVFARYLRAAAEITSRLLAEPDPLGSVGPMLRMLGETAGASRCYWFENTKLADGRLACSQRAEWCAPGVSEEIHNPELQNLPYESFSPDWQPRLEKGEPLSITRAEFPEAVRPILESQNSQGLLLIPMTVERRFAGFIGFDDCVGRGTWGAEEIDLLKAATDSFCHALERHAAEEERRRLEAQVQHAQKLESLGVMAGGIAHDFNNLLVAILGNAGLALSELPPDSPAHETVRDIETAAQRAAELTRQLLAYSGKGRFVVLPLDLNAIVDEMTHLFEVTVSKKAILRYDLSPGIPAVEGDATQLRQVIMNLILNASEALGDHGGTVAISTGVVVLGHGDLARIPAGEQLSAGTYAYVEVADTGSGMSPQTRDRIFEPFFTTKFTGRGLGLAAVLGIVRGHRGTIQVESQVGNGSRFRVLLPAADEPAESVPHVISAPTTVRMNGTVLVADDEMSVRVLASKLLKRMGFEVILATDGAEAVRLFRERADRISLVLLDMTMPEMGGEEVFTEIRRLCPDVKVILSSGYNEQDVIKDFAGLGLAGFLQKPYRLEELSAKVVEVLGTDEARGGRPQ